jgi:crotonobetainyl-CoA:carnitine CoA-transferase CaiB-like acyl-CoA transferase
MLSPYRVLDLTDEKGWLCAKLLADMGAEVVRIEKPGVTPARVYANTGKHCLSLNIETAGGRDLLKRLSAGADILVESMAPGYLPSLGLGYPELSEVNKKLIMVSITGFGQTGPYRDWQTSDLVAGALGGQVYVSGEPDKPPLKPFGPQAYSTASLFAANGVMLALWARHASGSGQYIDVSIHECVAATLDHVLVRYFYQGEIAERQGSLYWNRAFRIFPCRDGYILLSFFQHWDTLVEWLDSEGLAADLKDPRYASESERHRDIRHVIKVLENWTRQHSVRELVEIGQLMRFPWAEVASIPEVLENPQLNDRGYFVEAVDPGTGKRYKFPGAPVKMSGSPWKVHTRFPQAGDFNEEIYRVRLGLSGAEMESLAREGVI